MPVYYQMLHSKFGTDEKADIGKDNSSREDSITSLALSLNEDYIFVIDKQNQLQTIKYSHEKYQSDPQRFKYVHTAFHSQHITGMDVCLRKQLIVTTSSKSINIWNYNTRQLEISH